MSLVIGCSLAVAGVAVAQQPEASPTPGNKKGAGQPAPQTRHGHAQEQPGQNATQSPNPKQQRGPHNAPRTESTAGATPAATPVEHKGHQKQPASKSTSPAAQGEKAGAESNASATPSMTPQVHGRGAKNRPSNAKASPTPTASAAATATPKATATPSATASATPGKPATTATAAPEKAATATPVASATASPAGTAAAVPTPKPNTAAATKKPAPQQVQQIKSQNANFRAQPRPQQVPAVTFNPEHRIQGAEQWRTPQYEAFRSYRAERHDEQWYHSHYNRVELIGGGWYYWNDGYWYPAWGYRPSQEYYAYDGPIYVGRRAEPPDQVIADVQSELKDMGYYKGEVDGLVGPMTREALSEYQGDSGLYQTSAIDEPTLDSLGLQS